MLDPHPHDKAAALRVSISASISLAIMIVEFLLLIRDEIKYVWPRFRTSWTARIYMLSRYGGLASQTFSIAFTIRMFRGVYTSPAGCRIWFSFQALIVQLHLIFAQGLLMHRVYALFLHDQLILVLLIVFALGQTASMGVSASLSFPSNRHTVTCLLMRSNPGNAYFSGTTMTVNMIILFMTSWRYLRLPPKWTRQGIGKTVMRDSALSLGAISAMMLFLTLCSLQVIKPSMSGNITYYWLVCILWVSIGRIIVNHEKIPRDGDEQGEGDTWKGTLQLTSQIEMGQSVLSLDTQRGSLDGHSPTSNTLRSSFSTPTTKASQLPPSMAGTSYGSRKHSGENSPIDEHGHSPQPSSSRVLAEASIPNASRSSLSNVGATDGDASQVLEDRPQVDADADKGVHSPRSSPRPSCSEPPTSDGISS